MTATTLFASVCTSGVLCFCGIFKSNIFTATFDVVFSHSRENVRFPCRVIFRAKGTVSKATSAPTNMKAPSKGGMYFKRRALAAALQSV